MLLGLLAQALLSASADSGPREEVTGANGVRRSAGAGPLAEDPLLDVVAPELSQEMALGGPLGHIAVIGETVFQFLQRRGVAFRSAAENVARPSGPAERAAQAALHGFLARPTQRAKLLNPRFSAVGVGLVSLDDKTYPALIPMD